MTLLMNYCTYRAVIIAKLTYAASAWWGYASADRQRLEAVLRRAKRTGLCSNDELILAERVDRADDDLCEKVLSNPHHVLRNILPEEIAGLPYYGLKNRRQSY